MTSEGFQIFGLPPYAYYSAGIACYMDGPNSNQWMQDNHDVWNNSMDLAGINNRGVVGFKYFGFGGLAKATKGLPAFGGTKPGDGTTLQLVLTHGGHGAFKIHVMLDGPYTNSPWNGREIGVVEVPEQPLTAPGQPQVYSVAVPAVEGLTGKHAIYLVAEGADVPQPQPQERRFGPQQQPKRPEGLFTLHGIGFTKGAQELARPVVPQINISVDGQRLNIPAEPLPTTNANGYTECNRYQLYAPLSNDSQIRVAASGGAVQISISPVSDGRATVRCSYEGKEKIFLIN